MKTAQSGKTVLKIKILKNKMGDIE